MSTLILLPLLTPLVPLHLPIPPLSNHEHTVHNQGHVVPQILVTLPVFSFGQLLQLPPLSMFSVRTPLVLPQAPFQTTLSHFM
jgi:hypothetical protein